MELQSVTDLASFLAQSLSTVSVDTPLTFSLLSGVSRGPGVSRPIVLIPVPLNGDNTALEGAYFDTLFSGSGDPERSI